jgi:hypothetical protein
MEVSMAEVNGDLNECVTPKGKRNHGKDSWQKEEDSRKGFMVKILVGLLLLP